MPKKKKTSNCERELLHHSLNLFVKKKDEFIKQAAVFISESWRYSLNRFFEKIDSFGDEKCNSFYKHVTESFTQPICSNND